jgi:serine phosphatase RsbU (regulator of sigma subunit)
MPRAIVWLFAATLVLSAGMAAAFNVETQTPMVFSDPTGTQVLVDPDGTMGIDEALARIAEFKPADSLGKPDSRYHYWVLSTLNSQLASARELRIDAALWEQVISYVIEGNGPPKALRVTGAFRGVHNELADSNPFKTPISTAPSQFAVFTLNPGVDTRILVHVSANANNTPNTFTPSFSDNARQLELRRFGLMIEGLMVGIQLTLCIFGWYSALQNRDRTSVLYAAWIMFAMLSTGTLRVHDGSRLFELGIDVEGVRNGLHFISWNMTTIFSYAQAIGYVMFARSFLDLKTHMPRAYQFTNLYIAVTLIHLVIVNFIPHHLPGPLLWGPLGALVLFVLLTIFACAFRRYRQGLRVAMFFMLAMLPYLFFRMLFILGSLVQMQSPFAIFESKGFALFMQNPSTAQAFGVCCEALIMGLAVFSKNRWLQEELNQKMQAQAELVANQNQVLEATVAERTRELVESKADTERQHQLIVDSIAYASRLQKAQLPRAQRLDAQFRSWHAIWEPRDTIGGDVWWTSPADTKGRISIVLADSTGHGVPGAMLSVLISTSLERMYATQPDLDPAAALMQLDHALRMGLNQDGADANSDDGCDAAILRIDPQSRAIEFAGAKLGLLRLRTDGNVERVQPTRISLGYQDKPQQEPALQTLQCAPGDVLLLVTDGITDQIGGTGIQRAYGYKRLTAQLARCAGKDAATIAQAMRDDLLQWQDAQMRRDDATAVVLQLN